MLLRVQSLTHAISAYMTTDRGESHYHRNTHASTTLIGDIERAVMRRKQFPRRPTTASSLPKKNMDFPFKTLHIHGECTLYSVHGMRYCVWQECNIKHKIYSHVNALLMCG